MEPNAASGTNLYDKRVPYNCNSCNRLFVVQVRSAYIHGRIPLILPCTHLQCEECVTPLFKNKSVTCSVCHDVTLINDPCKTLRDYFPIDRYILGNLLKIRVSERSFRTPVADRIATHNVTIIPAGYTKAGVKSSYLSVNSKSNLIEPNLMLGCSKLSGKDCLCSQHPSCHLPADWRCLECEEVYCDICNTKVHNTARALRKHVRFPIGTGDISDFSVSCFVHLDAFPEYCCVPCDLLLCSKCIIKDHQGHEVITILEKNVCELPTLKDSLTAAEKMLKRLQCEHQKVSHEILAFKQNIKSNPVELNITKQFSYLHTRLQMLEQKILNGLTKNEDMTALQNISQELDKNISKVCPLVSVGNLVANSEYLDRIVVKELTKKLNEILNIPCFLHCKKVEDTEIQCSVDDTIFNTIEEMFSIQKDYQSKYKLIPLSEFPTEIDLLPTMEELANLSVSSVPSRASSVSSLSSITKSDWGASGKAELSYMENANSAKHTSKKMEKTKFEEINLVEGITENVIITHLSSPELFYVQLSRMSKQIDMLTNKYGQYAENAKIPENPELNKTYIIQYISGSFKKWYRGTVINIIESEELLYEVFYIDYGNTSVVPLSKIREINPNFLAVPSFVYPCSIYNLISKDINWNPEVVPYMIQFITGMDNKTGDPQSLEKTLIVHERCKQLQMTVMKNRNGFLQVELVMISSEDNEHVSLRSALIFMGFGQPISDVKNPLVRNYGSLVRRRKIPFAMGKFVKEQVYNVIVSKVTDPEEIYVQIHKNRPIIDDLVFRMKRYYNKATNKDKDKIYLPEKGMICATLFGQNWWRAEIIDLPGEGLVEVYALDYGIVEVVCWTKVRKLRSDFLSVDAQAVNVKMSFIRSPNFNKWPNGTSEFLRNYTKQKVLKMIVDEPSTHQLGVTLYESTPEIDICINALLVREELAESTAESIMLVEYHKLDPAKIRQEKEFCIENSLLDDDDKSQLASCKFLRKNQKIEGEMKKKEAFHKMVVVLNIETPDCFYVCLPEWILERNCLTRDLKYFYSSKKRDPQKWEIGQKCAVLSTVKNAWYRAIIIDVLDNNKYHVFMKDVAHKEIADPENMFPLNEKFLNIRDLSVKCNLAGIYPAGDKKQWSATAVEYFKELVEKYHQLYIMKQGTDINRENKSLPVNLYATWEEDGGPLSPSIIRKELLNSLLIEKGVALPLNCNIIKKSVSKPQVFEKKTDEVIKNQELRPDKDDDKSSDQEVDPFYTPGVSPVSVNIYDASLSVPQFFQWIKPKPLISKQFKGIATYVDNDGYVYLHDVCYDMYLKQMQRVLNNHFLKTSQDPEHKWEIGQPCIVQYHLDKSYYRAIVSGIKQDKIIVFFIDYGNEEVCSHCELRSEILLKSEPAVATRCKMLDVHPLTKNGTWPVAILDKLHHTIVEKELNVAVIDSDDNNEELPSILLVLQNAIINKEIMTWDWHMPETIQVDDNVLTDDEVVIEGVIEDILSEDEKIGDWVSMANLEILNQVKYEYVTIRDDVTTFEAAVINVLDYRTVIIEGSFYADLLNETVEKFDNMLIDMNENGPKQPPLFDPVVGHPCCTEYAADGNWYRAEIYSLDFLDPFDKVQVLFVDYGNIEVVSRKTVRILKKEWAECPVQLIRCNIWGVTKCQNVSNIEITKSIENEMIEKRFLTTVKKRKPNIEVSFHDINTKELAYQKLIDEGLLFTNH